ncbi:hypothetical protein [Methylobacterium pseudosasicola]|nr:hypothetical protein [Methylobacterium pseudosasicola]
MNEVEKQLAQADAGDRSAGEPAMGSMDHGAREPLGGPGLHHWRQSTMT